jgi:hypothetical protein
MSTFTAATFSIVKDKFAEVITKRTLFPTNKPTEWNMVITEKAILNAMKTPFPPPAKEIRCGFATLYNTVFPTSGDYQEFTANQLTPWGNTLNYKHFNVMYMSHRSHVHSINKLQEQVMSLLKEANRINNRDLMLQHKIEGHVGRITRADLQQHIKKPQQVQAVVSPTPIPSLSQHKVFTLPHIF